MESAKAKIKLLVKDYMSVFTEEFNEFRGAAKEKISLQNTKFGEVKGGGLVERVLHEIPETLYVIIMKHRDESEFKWYQSKEGARWFAKNFKQFNVTEKV